MDTPAAGECGEAEEVHLQPPPSVGTGTSISSSEEGMVVPEAEARKNVDNSEDTIGGSGGATGEGSRMDPGSAPTDSNAAIVAAAASARAAVVASAVSSITALVAAATMSMPPPRFHAECKTHFTPGSTFGRGILGGGRRRSTASVTPSGLPRGMSSFFVGHVPWPKEGSRDVEEEGHSGGNKPTTTTSSTPTPTPTPPTPAVGDASRTPSGRKRNDGVDSHEGVEGRREVEKGGGSSKVGREGQTRKGGGALSQRPGWKTHCETNRCNKSASFGYFGGKGQFCVKHKMEGMINLRRGRCQVEGCPKPPTRILMGGQKVRFCKEHWPPEMSRQCRHPEGCTRLATHAPPQEAGVGQSPVVAASPEASPPPAAPEQANGDSSKGGGGAVGGERGDPPVVVDGTASSEVSVVEVVANPDGGGTASTVKVNGSGAPEASGTGSVDAGALASAKDAFASGGPQGGGDGRASGPGRGDSSTEARGLDTSASGGLAAGLMLPTRCSEHAGLGWVNVFSVDSGGGSSIGNGDKGGAMDVQLQTDGQQQRSKRRRSTGGGWASSHDDDFLYGDGDEDGNGDEPKVGVRERNADGTRHDGGAPDDSSGDFPAADAAAAALTMGLRTMDNDMGDKDDLFPPGPDGMIIKGRWAGKTKNIEKLSCPHHNSKHYCHGKCKLCYMKEYNRRTRALNGASSKVGRKPGVDKGADATVPPANSESDATTSPEAAPPFVGLRKRRRPEAKSPAAAAPAAATATAATTTTTSTEHVPTERVFRRTVSSCEHSDAPHYGKGFCRPCYMREYNKAKRRGEEVVRLPAPPRVVVSYGPRGAKGSSSSAGDAGTVTGAAAAPVTAATTVTSFLTRGQSAAVPKTTALPPPLCAECGQTEKSWPLVLICDGCEATFHLGCQGRSNQPIGEWFCFRCTEILLDSDSESEIETGDPENAAGRNPTDPGSTKACTRSATPARGDAANPAYDSRAATPDRKMSRSGSGESALASGREGPIPCASLDGGGAGASAAVGWQTPRPVAAGGAASDSCGVQAAATFRVGTNGHGGRAAAGVKGRWHLKGDVRGCRCPTCVSILLQSGGTRPPEAKKVIVLGEAAHAAPVSAPFAASTRPRTVGSYSAAAADAATASTLGTKRRRQRFSRPSPAAEAVSAGMGRRSSSADGGTSGADRAQGARGARSALYSRVVVRAGSAPASSASASSANASASRASTANASSTKIHSVHASPGKVPSKDASSAPNASSRGNAAPSANAAPMLDARDGPRPSRAKRKRHREDEESEWGSYSSEGGPEAEVLGARCGIGTGKGKEGAACSDDGSYLMSSDGASSDGNEPEEGGAPRRRKRAGRTKKKSGTGPDADADAVVSDGNRKGVITACEHTNRPLYSKGSCKPCYMVNYWDRRHAAIGIKPRSPRSGSGAQKKGNKVRAQDSATQNALSPNSDFGSSTTGPEVPAAAAVSADSEGARPKPYGRAFEETRTDVDADSGDGETVDVEDETPEPAPALGVKSEAGPGKSTSSEGSGATGNYDDSLGEARNGDGVTHAPTGQCVNEDCQGCDLCSDLCTEAGGAVGNDAGISKTVGAKLTRQPAAVRPTISMGAKAVASLVTTAGPKQDGVSHDTQAAARPSGGRISIPKTVVVRSVVPAVPRPAKPLTKTCPETPAPSKGSPTRAGQGAGDVKVATKKRPRSPHEGETSSVPASSDDVVPGTAVHEQGVTLGGKGGSSTKLSRGCGEGAGRGLETLPTRVKRVKISAPREQAPGRAVGAPAQRSSNSAAVDARAGAGPTKGDE